MNQVALSVLVGLLAGAGGALAVSALQGTPATAPGAALPTQTEPGDLGARLDRIERLLEKEMLSSGPALRGTAAQPASGPGGAPSDAYLDALVAKMEERLRPTIQDSVTASIEKAVGEGDLTLEKPGEAPPEKEKKKVTLAELAAELQLTAAEEEEVRRITNETTDKFVKLLVDENQSVEDLKREFESARTDPAKQAELSLKYMGKIMGNIGPMIALGLEHDGKMAKAIGKERADKLDEEYEVTDLDPLGLKSIFDKD